MVTHMWSHPLESDKGKPLLFGGHCFYVTKCVSGDADTHFWDRSIGGIKLPETSAEFSLYVEVKAKGPRVGLKCTKPHAKRYARQRQLPDSVKIGDLMFCPNESVGIKRTPICDARGKQIQYEYFIEESIPLGIDNDHTIEKLRPWGDRVLAEMIVEEETGGILFVDPELRAVKARIIQVGTGSISNGGPRKWDVKVGDTILVMKRSGIDLGADSGNRNLKIFREIEILGVESEED